MTRTALALALAVGLAVACFGQQPARTKTAKLPFGWSKIGLSDAQKKQLRRAGVKRPRKHD